MRDKPGLPRPIPAAARAAVRADSARRGSRRRARGALTRIARCGVRGGSIGVATGRYRRQAVKSYMCVYHHKRGPAVCPVTVYQPIEDVEPALVADLDRDVLTPDVIATMTREIRAAIEAQLPSRDADASELERELRGREGRAAALDQGGCPCR